MGLRMTGLRVGAKESGGFGFAWLKQWERPIEKHAGPTVRTKRDSSVRCATLEGCARRSPQSDDRKEKATAEAARSAMGLGVKTICR